MAQLIQHYVAGRAAWKRDYVAEGGPDRRLGLGSLPRGQQ
jgi:hypothetical protein